VIPCFNEETRWSDDYWSALATRPDINLCFVDDGSSDGTAEIIERLQTRHDVLLIRLAKNAGKGEAVRIGLNTAMKEGNDIVGFLDADGAFPVTEVFRLIAMAEEKIGGYARLDSLWSSRVLLAGREISRSNGRHYVARMVATLIAPLHGYKVYDTQSGFKLFANTSELSRCLEDPFLTRWFFDVEILQRWSNSLGNRMNVWEEPVQGWRDVRGSKINSSQYLQLMRDLRNLRKGRVNSAILR